MLECLTIEYLQEGLVDVVDVMGIDRFKKLVKFCSGSNLYITSEKHIAYISIYYDFTTSRFY